MSILKKLFGGKSKNSDLQRDFEGYIPDALSALLKIQLETGLHWTTILPAAKRLAAMIILKSLGQAGADQLYDKWLSDTEKKGTIPASAIREFKVPIATPDEIELATSKVLDFINLQIVEGNNVLTLAMALDNSANIIARRKVASWYATGLAKQIQKEVKAGSFDL